MSFSLIASRYAPYPLSFGLLQAPFNLLSKNVSRTSSYGEFGIICVEIDSFSEPDCTSFGMNWYFFAICQRISSPVAL